MAEQQAAAATPAAEAPVPETIGEVLASENLDAFRDKPAEEAQPKHEPAKPKRGKGKAKLRAVEPKEGPGDEGEDEQPAEGDEPTEPDIKTPLPKNEEAEAAAFSDEALATPEGVKAAREILLASRAATEKRNHVLDRYDMRSKERMTEARQLVEQVTARSQQVEHVAGLITRDLQLFREPGITAKEKLAALSRLAGGRPGHEIIDELTAGILSDGKEQPIDPTVRELRRQLAEQAEQFRLFQESLKAQQIQGQADAQKQQIAQIYAQVQEAAADADAYPELASGLEEGDWTPEEVAEMVAGPEGIMVKHYRAHKERLDKSEALRILEGRLARRRGGERAPQGVPGAGATKKPGSPARGAGRGTTITPSVADRSTGSVRELKTREERIADLQRDPAALKQLFPMLG